MKVAYILDSFPNVSETFISDEIYSVVQAGIDCRIFALRRGKATVVHPRAQSLIEAGKVQYLRTPTAVETVTSIAHIGVRNPNATMRVLMLAIGAGRRRWIAREAASLAAEVVKFRCTHLHAHFADRAAQTAMWVHRWTSIPFTFTTHGYDVFQQPPTNLDELVNEAQNMVCISNFNRNYLASSFALDQRKLEVIHCGIYLDDFEGQTQVPTIDKESVHLLCVARLVNEKGHSYLFQAIRLLRESGIPVNLTLVGDGPLRQSLSELAKDLGIDRVVNFLGAKSSTEVRSLFQQCDIAVIASVSESMGLVNMEGMISGRPVIATNVFGVPELVEDRVTGFLCEPRDPVCIAETVRWILERPAETARIVEQGKKRVREGFNRITCTEKLISVWGGARSVGAQVASASL
jgi:glycosyltransferase involved in cell wall biosynthesis